MQFILLLMQTSILQMKYISKIFAISILIIVIISCEEEQKPRDTEKFKDELQSFNNSMDKVDQTMNVMDDMQDEIDEIDENIAKGEMSEQDGALKKEQVNKDYSRELAKSANVNPTRKLPDWARKLGLKEAQGLRIDRDISQTTSEDNPSEGYNSVLLVYLPDYEKAMEQAAIIAKGAGIPMTDDYVMAMKMAEDIGETIIKGVAYMNFELGSDNLPQYTIAITVDENGVLVISANDTYKMTEQLTQ